MRIHTLPVGGKLLTAARHNRRAFDNEAQNIDRSLSHLNYILYGPPTVDQIMQDAKAKREAAGVLKERSNGVAALEVLFSLPTNTQIDDREYFTKSLEWARNQFGRDNILSADVHLDESAPHCHVLILPLLEGRMRGNDMMGNRSAMLAKQASFHEEVSQYFGLKKPTTLNYRIKKLISEAVLKQLRQENDSSLRSQVWSVIQDCIGFNPQPWAQCIGVSIPKEIGKPSKSDFVGIMIKKVKNEPK